MSVQTRTNAGNGRFGLASNPNVPTSNLTGSLNGAANLMGSLYKRPGSKNWVMAVMIAGRQHCKTTNTPNKRLAGKILSRWETSVFEGRFQLPSSNPPRFEDWADQFLISISHSNTRRR